MFELVEIFTDGRENPEIICNRCGYTTGDWTEYVAFEGYEFCSNCLEHAAFVETEDLGWVICYDDHS